MVCRVEQGVALASIIALASCAGADVIQPRPPQSEELPSIAPRTSMGVQDDDVSTRSARLPPAEARPQQRSVECPQGSKWTGIECLATRIQCPFNSTLEETVEGQRCVGEVFCPAGTLWAGRGCEPQPKVGSTAGATSISPPRCELHINSIPPSEVFIDGKKVGVTPIVMMRAAEGRHLVRFLHAELGRIDRAVACEAGKTVTVAVKFGKTPQARGEIELD